MHSHRRDITKMDGFMPVHMERLEDRILLSSDLDLLDPLDIPKFVNPLPDPAVIDATNGGRFRINMKETEQWLGLVDDDGDPLMTTVWGYGKGNRISYPGPTIEARTDVPVKVRWNNKLPEDGHLLPVDTSIHWANPDNDDTVPTVTHLHGGHTESASDGLPEAWFTQRFRERGPHFVKKTYHYDNDQEAATLWYHDHALGITRLNVYAGLAGFYLLRDANEDALNLPSGEYEREIVIQDRIFTDEGELYYPSEPELPDQPEPSVLPEFFGDSIVVNGMAWPYLEVEPREYRLRMLNGSDSRFYVLEFGGGEEFLQIGTDVGLLDSPVALTQLVIGPGERADLVVDFSELSGEQIILRNLGPDEPFKGVGIGETANPDTTGIIMQFNVSLPLDTDVIFADVDQDTQLRSEPFELPDPDGPTRRVVLFEGEDQFGRLRPQLGILDPDSLLNGSLLWDEEITETPMLDSTEVWEIYNATEDAHPIHLHLVAFQILNRQEFKGEAVTVGEDPIEGGTKQVLELKKVIGQPEDPAPNETGPKDTIQVLPGQVARVVATFDRPGRYVWHCHILSHEDHEMMRPYYIGTMPSSETCWATIRFPVLTTIRFPSDPLVCTLPSPTHAWRRKWSQINKLGGYSNWFRQNPTSRSRPRRPAWTRRPRASTCGRGRRPVNLLQLTPGEPGRIRSKGRGIGAGSNWNSTRGCRPRRFSRHCSARNPASIRMASFGRCSVA